LDGSLGANSFGGGNGSFYLVGLLSVFDSLFKARDSLHRWIVDSQSRYLQQNLIFDKWQAF
jgi:hypothetical protein